MRLHFRMRIYGYVVMPEHVHLVVSEPEHGNLAEAMHYLKLSFSKLARSLTGPRLASKGRTRTWGTSGLWDAMNRSGRRDTMTGTCAACASLASSCAICIEIQ